VNSVAAISDPESFFTTLGEGVARQIDDLAMYTRR